MPANVTPEYRKAEEMFRQAGTAQEKITALELMLSTIPKHKGTEHMQSDIKRRLAKLREGNQGKAAKGGVDIFHVPRGAAAGQVALLGTPNSGKSALVAALTKAHVEVADYPFATHAPVPGMMHFEDIQIQLVDMPPITREHVEPGQTNTYRHCDLILVVLDLATPGVLEELEICWEYLHERTLIPPEGEEVEGAVYAQMCRPVLAVASKVDLAKEGDLEVLREMAPTWLEIVAVSVKDAAILAAFSRRLFERLGIVRVYSKIPGKKADMHDPFTLPVGSTVEDLAVKVHRDLAEKLRFARAWGEGKFDAQQVPRDYAIQDRDVIELHFA